MEERFSLSRRVPETQTKSRWLNNISIYRAHLIFHVFEMQSNFVCFLPFSFVFFITLFDTNFYPLLIKREKKKFRTPPSLTNDKNFILRVLPYSYDFSFSPRRNDKKFYTSYICTLNARPGCNQEGHVYFIHRFPPSRRSLRNKGKHFRFVFTGHREREAKRLQIEKITIVVVETGVVNNVVDLVSNSEGKGEKDLEKTKQSERNNCKSTLERMSKQISRDEDEGK